MFVYDADIPKGLYVVTSMMTINIITQPEFHLYMPKNIKTFQFNRIFNEKKAISLLKFLQFLLKFSQARMFNN